MDDEDKDAAARRLCREVASAILAAMQAADMGFEDIAAILGGDARTYRNRFMRMAEGRGGDIRLSHVSDFLFSLGFRARLGVEPDVDEAPMDAETGLQSGSDPMETVENSQ